MNRVHFIRYFKRKFSLALEFDPSTFRPVFKSQLISFPNDNIGHPMSSFLNSQISAQFKFMANRFSLTHGPCCSNHSSLNRGQIINCWTLHLKKLELASVWLESRLKALQPHVQLEHVHFQPHIINLLTNMSFQPLDRFIERFLSFFLQNEYYIQFKIRPSESQWLSLLGGLMPSGYWTVKDAPFM